MVTSCLNAALSSDGYLAFEVAQAQNRAYALAEGFQLQAGRSNWLRSVSPLSGADRASRASGPSATSCRPNPSRWLNPKKPSHLRLPKQTQERTHPRWSGPPKR
jgi:hypothetical protein